MELGIIIGNNIKDYRQKHGFSQDHIANYLGVDRTTVSKYESGEREVSLVHLNKLSDLFGIDIEDLVEVDSAKKNINLAFAFRSEGILEEDINSIAEFQKIVKNYVKMLRISNEKK